MQFYSNLLSAVNKQHPNSNNNNNNSFTINNHNNNTSIGKTNRLVRSNTLAAPKQQQQQSQSFNEIRKTSPLDRQLKPMSNNHDSILLKNTRLDSNNNNNNNANKITQNAEFYVQNNFAPPGSIPIQSQGIQGNEQLGIIDNNNTNNTTSTIISQHRHTSSFVGGTTSTKLSSQQQQSNQQLILSPVGPVLLSHSTKSQGGTMSIAAHLQQQILETEQQKYKETQQIEQQSQQSQQFHHIISNTSNNTIQLSTPSNKPNGSQVFRKRQVASTHQGSIHTPNINQMILLKQQLQQQQQQQQSPSKLQQQIVQHPPNSTDKYKITSTPKHTGTLNYPHSSGASTTANISAPRTISFVNNPTTQSNNSSSSLNQCAGSNKKDSLFNQQMFPSDGGTQSISPNALLASQNNTINTSLLICKQPSQQWMRRSKYRINSNYNINNSNNTSGIMNGKPSALQLSQLFNENQVRLNTENSNSNINTSTTNAAIILNSKQSLDQQIQQISPSTHLHTEPTSIGYKDKDILKDTLRINKTPQHTRKGNNSMSIIITPGDDRSSVNLNEKNISSQLFAITTTTTGNKGSLKPMILLSPQGQPQPSHPFGQTNIQQIHSYKQQLLQQAQLPQQIPPNSTKHNQERTINNLNINDQQQQPTIIIPSSQIFTNLHKTESLTPSAMPQKIRQQNLSSSQNRYNSSLHQRILSQTYNKDNNNKLKTSHQHHIRQQNSLVIAIDDDNTESNNNIIQQTTNSATNKTSKNITLTMKMSPQNQLSQQQAQSSAKQLTTNNEQSQNQQQQRSQQQYNSLINHDNNNWQGKTITAATCSSAKNAGTTSKSQNKSFKSSNVGNQLSQHRIRSLSGKQINQNNNNSIISKNSQNNNNNNSTSKTIVQTLQDLQQPQQSQDKNTSILINEQNNQNNTNWDKLTLPIGPQEAIDNYKQHLTEYELEEIKQYLNIYYLGHKITKQPRVLIKQSSGTSEQTLFNSGYDDEKGDYQYTLFDHVAYRYELVGQLGKGSFGQVLKVWDHKRQEFSALKIIRNKSNFYNQALVELNILKFIKDHDINQQSNIVQIKDFVVFRNHVCIVFELLSLNLYEFLKNNKFNGISLELIRRFAIQILQGLLFLKKTNIVHCDLKPENILLKQENKSGIKIVDFGSSCFQNQRVYTYIQSRFYRAPEIILGLPYGQPIDMWSFGCILAELYIGYPLFPGENEAEQFQMFMEVLGVPDPTFVEVCPRQSVFFENIYTPKQSRNSRGKLRIPKTRDINYYLRCPDKSFVDFLNLCFTWEQSIRITPAQALVHDWILEGLPTEIRAQHLHSMQLAALDIDMRNQFKKYNVEWKNYQITKGDTDKIYQNKNINNISQVANNKNQFSSQHQGQTSPLQQQQQQQQPGVILFQVDQKQAPREDSKQSNNSHSVGMKSTNPSSSAASAVNHQNINNNSNSDTQNISIIQSDIPNSTQNTYSTKDKDKNNNNKQINTKTKQNLELLEYNNFNPFEKPQQDFNNNNNCPPATSANIQNSNTN